MERKTRVDPQDNTVYEWDEEKKAWFPMITEDFLAHYHANYGFVDNATPAVATQEKPVSPTKVHKEKPSEKEGWFEIDPEKNNNVYVSGLPKDIEQEEFEEFMSKCGIIQLDQGQETTKCKLYKDREGKNKGDGVCCYLKHESVELALTILDGQHIRHGFPVHVEPAVFKMKGDYDPKLKKKRKKKQKQKIQQKQSKLLDWVDRDGVKPQKHLSVVVIKNAFTPHELDEKPQLILEIKSNLRNLAEDFGKVKRVMVFDGSPEGACSITFENNDIADTCRTKLSQKVFRGRVISTLIWDGVTDYKVVLTAEEEKKRIEKWNQFLEAPDNASPP